VDIDLISGYIIVSRVLGVCCICVEIELAQAMIDVLITPNVVELAARYTNVSGVLEKRHFGLESTVVKCGRDFFFFDLLAFCGAGLRLITFHERQAGPSIRLTAL
jgi:hypothetical protein